MEALSFVMYPELSNWLAAAKYQAGQLIVQVSIQAPPQFHVATDSNSTVAKNPARTANAGLTRSVATAING